MSVTCRDYNAGFQNALARMAGATQFGLASAGDMIDAEQADAAGTDAGAGGMPATATTKSNVPLIVGVAVGGVVLLLIIVGITVYMKRASSSSVTTTHMGKETA